MELLFESRMDVVKWIEGKIYPVQCRAALEDAPVLVGDTPVDGGGVSVYGTVLRDGGRFRMWYHAWPKDWDDANATLVAYACEP